MGQDLWFERLVEITEHAAEPARAPARLKAKIYSAMVSRLAESGPLLDLVETKAAGRRLCVFEDALTRLPLGAGMRSANPCRICHARVLGERMEKAPIFWPGCPYSEFHDG
jgi:hypothetical protein